MIARVLLSIVAVALFWAYEAVSGIAGTLYSAKAAGQQFASSDAAYAMAAGQMSLWRAAALPAGILLLILLLIWWPLLRRRAALLSIALLLGTAALPGPARAYYDTTDRAEAYTILPNESAFWIPDAGDRKNDQSRLESEAFLEANRISVARFVIPHAKFQNSGGWFGIDGYVPTGRLIIVDRSPFTREWVDHPDRGTSVRKEGFPCQSREGLNITAGVTIGTSVADGPQASKFLYRFGVKRPAGDRGDRAVIFTSVYFSRSLAEVMDDVGRKQIQAIVCREFAARTLDRANEEANAVMAAVEQEARKYLGSVGISLDFIGWADTFTFDHDVQKAINDRYVADKLQPVASLLAALTQLKVQEGLSAGLASKGLPVVVTPGMLEALAGLASKAAPALPVGPAPP